MNTPVNRRVILYGKAINIDLKINNISALIIKIINTLI